jgi:hypothetical protein
MLDGVVPILDLLVHSLDDTLDRWLEEAGDVDSVKRSIRSWSDFGTSRRLPRQLELAKSDIASFIVISRASEFDVLWLLVVTEPDFC